MRESDVWSLATCDLHLHVDVVRGGFAAGGLRIAAGATSEDAARLARLMSLKLALCHVPIGGAKVVAAPRPGAPREEMLTEIGETLRPYLSSSLLLGEDLGATSADVVAVYTAAQVDPVAVVRAKFAERGIETPIPEGLALSDLMNEEFAGTLAGTGAVRALQAVHDAPLAGARASIQGFGTVGLAVARALVAAGVSVVAVTDVEGSVHDPGGLDLEALAAARHPDGRIDRQRLGAQPRLGPREDWLEISAEIVVPAAVADAITAENESRLSPEVRFVLEGANDPVTAEAERLLTARGIQVVPDILANAGSAVAFGLLASGLASVPDVGERYLEQIADAARRSAQRAAGGSLREAVLAEAEDFLAADALTGGRS